jgi:LmbE family N-acetylglucosaminyl deacetylase
MRWIYISPHLDDAVLSCGGLIWEQARQGTPVEIWTVVCGFPQPQTLSDFANALHEEWGFSSAEQAVTFRRQEDQAAAKKVGAKTLYFDIPDCIYRLSPENEPLYTDVFVPPHPAEAKLPARIATDLSSGLERDDVLVCPLTIGGHVDHVLVRMAVEQFQRPRWYYADIPYLLNEPQALAPATSNMNPRQFKVSPEGLHVWQDGIAAYASQIGILFEDEDRMRALIRDYWMASKGLQLWQARDGLDSTLDS